VTKALTVTVLALALAQSSGPAFEVASVKPVDRDSLRQKGLTCGFSPGGRFMAFGWLRYMIACAYDIGTADPQRNIPNGPDWLDVDIFEITANSPADHIPRSRVEGLPMLRSLLAERFKLRVHMESREVPIYALVVARPDRQLGPRLLPTAGDCAAWIAGGRLGAPPPGLRGRPCGLGWASRSAIGDSVMTMTRLATMLSPRVDRPVEDRTGLTGTFSVDLQWTPEPQPAGASDEQRPSFLPPADPSGPSLFTALPEQLGLELQPVKGSIDILVVDHVERPTPN